MRSSLVLTVALAMMFAAGSAVVNFPIPTVTFPPVPKPPIPNLSNMSNPLEMLISTLANVLEPFSPANVADKCHEMLGNSSFGIVCDFFSELIALDESDSCNPMPIIGGNLTIVVDIGVGPCNMTGVKICGNPKYSVLEQVLKLVGCVLKNLTEILKHVGNLVKSAGKTASSSKETNMLVNAALFLVYTVVKKVLEILCMQPAILISLLLSLAPLVFMILLAAGLGLFLGVPVLGPILFVVVLLLIVIVVPLVAVISLLLLGLVLLLEVLLVPISVLLIILISDLTGIEDACRDSACSAEPESFIDEIKCLPSTVYEEFLAFFGNAPEAFKGLLQPLLERVLALLGPIVKGVLQLIGPLAVAIGDILQSIN